MSSFRATVFGATGLVGQSLVQFLAEDQAYEKVFLANRRKVEYSHPKLENQVVDFDKLEAKEKLFSVDHIFIAVGTTIKKAGSKDKFKAVDSKIPAEVARLSRAQKIIMVSSLGADPKASNFYLKTKGEAEELVKSKSKGTVHIVRPSLLLGDRKEKRLGESIAKSLMQSLSFLLQGPLKKYRGIQAKTVAQSMIYLAKNKSHSSIVESEEMKNLIHS